MADSFGKLWILAVAAAPALVSAGESPAGPSAELRVAPDDFELPSAETTLDPDRLTFGDYLATFHAAIVTHSRRIFLSEPGERGMGTLRTQLYWSSALTLFCGGDAFGRSESHSLQYSCRAGSVATGEVSALQLLRRQVLLQPKAALG